MRTKLFIGNLGDDGHIRSEDLRPLFERFGNVTECECVKNYAFVHMESEKSAQEALDNLNGTVVKGRNIKVEKSESRGPKRPSQKLFIGNLAEGTTSDQLRQIFEEFTPVLEADIIKNYGFVHIDADSGRSKINEIIKELNGYSLNGSSIRVQLSTSGVRQKPGMGGNHCYRCGKEGHWSKECPIFPDQPNNGFGDSRGGDHSRGGSGRGGPVRSGTQGRSGQSNNRGEPYPAPPPPSYVRERMESRDGFGGRGGGHGGHSSYGNGQSSSSGGYGHQLSDSSSRGAHRPLGHDAPYQRGLDVHPHPQQQQPQPVQQNFYERSQNFGTMASGRDFGGQSLRGPEHAPYQAQPSFGQPIQFRSTAPFNPGAGGPPQFQPQQLQSAQPQLQVNLGGGYSLAHTAFTGGAFTNPLGGNFAANTSSFSELVRFATNVSPFTAPFGASAGQPNSEMFSRRSPRPSSGAPPRQYARHDGPDSGSGSGFGQSYNRYGEPRGESRWRQF